MADAYADELHPLDAKLLEHIAGELALKCLPIHRTPEWEKDRIYWKALQMAWLAPSSKRGAEMLAELENLKDLGKVQYTIAAAVEIIKKYHKVQFAT